ncbi:MAG: L17 family ribosomal protein [Candidatus Hodgkinia cicadicola]
MRTLRLVRSKLKCKQVTAWALVLLASAFERKDGGYVRILKFGKRLGDSAHMSAMLPNF